ncbi:MAG: S41 family peptidase [Proteobacteria bacterium]|nr:S41 family peptidase [Pseudomonadota bacterium]
MARPDRVILFGCAAALLAFAGAAEAGPRHAPSAVSIPASAPWRPDEAGAHYGFTSTVRRGPQGAVVALRSPDATPREAIGHVSRDLDAKPWRGKAVTLTARVRLIRGSWAGVGLHVRAADPARTGFDADSHGAPVTADGRWRTVTLNARISADATRLSIRLAGTGPMAAEFQAVRLSVRAPDTRPMSPEAAAYLQTALDFIHENHVNAVHNPDWPRLVAQARADAAGARTPGETHGAISALLGDLKEHHASFAPPAFLRAMSAQNTDPKVELADGRFGVVTLTSVDIGTPEDEAFARRYVEQVRGGLHRLDAKPLCGWIVDLRGDYGGSTQVMADAVEGLALFSRADWPDEYPDPSELPPELRWIFTQPEDHLTQGARPVAVLIGPRTASAGEDVALRFVGRDAARSFGAPTAGFVSGNAWKRMSDGAGLAVPVSYMHDRKGRPQRDSIQPDEPATDAMAAAERWLEGQCADRAH